MTDKLKCRWDNDFKDEIKCSYLINAVHCMSEFSGLWNWN